MNPKFTSALKIAGSALAVVLLSMDLSQAYNNGQNATYVLGQPNFTSAGGGLSQNRLNKPRAALYDPDNDRLFVSDFNNNRVLIYLLTGGVVDNMNATYVLGQPNFDTNTPNLTQTGLKGPLGLAYDAANQRLFVADSGNSRVLVYNLSGPISNEMPASKVLCQQFFNTQNISVTADHVNMPYDVAYDPTSHQLFVADSNYRRVLVFDLTGGINDGMPASHVLGQTLFDSQVGGVSQSKMQAPRGLAVDALHHRLFVGDLSGRVLIFNIANPIIDGMDASYVLGQSDFGTATPAATQSGVNYPTGLSYDAVSQHLYAGDLFYNRVLDYDLSGPLSNGMPASAVLGQSNFTSVAAATSQNGLNQPAKIGFDSSRRRLFVADALNDRVLVFTPPGCDRLAVCGTITAAEDPTQPIIGTIVQLRDSNGAYLTSKRTSTDGSYSFETTDGIALNHRYLVSPVVNQMESAIPFQVPTLELTIQGAIADFKVGGRPGVLISRSTPPGSLILISTNSYTNSDSNLPPTLRPSSSAGTYYAATTAGWDGIATLQAPMGSYYVTCWFAQHTASSLTTNYVRSPLSGSSGPYSILPNTTCEVTCPSL